MLAVGGPIAASFLDIASDLFHHGLPIDNETKTP